MKGSFLDLDFICFKFIITIFRTYWVNITSKTRVDVLLVFIITSDHEFTYELRWNTNNISSSDTQNPKYWGKYLYKVYIKITRKIPMNIVPDYSLLTLNRYLPAGKHMSTGVSQVFPPQTGARVPFLVKIQAAVSFLL